MSVSTGIDCTLILSSRIKFEIVLLTTFKFHLFESSLNFSPAVGIL